MVRWQQTTFRDVGRPARMVEAANDPGDARTPTPSAPTGGGGGLDWFSFFVANLQTGFGPFVSVYLTSERWTQIDIGLVLTTGSLIGLLGQVPGGAFVDRSPSKRTVAAGAVAAVGMSALGLGFSSFFPIILAAWILHAVASCLIAPAVNSLSLDLVGYRALSRRLGRNASFASVGSAVAAAGMGAIGYYVSHQAVFVVAAALAVPSIFALSRIPAERSPAVRGAELAPRGPAPTGTGPARTGSVRTLLTDRALLAIAGCVLLFHLANGAMLPLLGSALTVRSSMAAPILIAACIIVPQIVVAFASPWVGERAIAWGRRPLLIAGFVALALRGVFLGMTADPYLLVATQLLDGISAAVLGVVVPTALADVTRGTGRFALAQGMMGTGIGIGAALSTTLGGVLADRFGTTMAFYGLSLCAGAGLLAALVWFPETDPGHAPAKLDRK